MNAIKLQFKLMGKKTQFERDLIKLVCHPDLSLPPEKLFSPILLGFKEKDSSSSKQNIKLFLENLSTLKRWEDVAKCLIIVHQAIHDEISDFIHEFAVSDLANIIELPEDKEEFKLYVRCGLMKYYYRYLKKMADAHYSLIKCKRYSSRDYLPLLKQNDKQLIFQHHQLKELVAFVAKVEDFYVSATDLLKIPILQLIGEMMLRDCIEMYNQISNFVSKTIESIFQLPEDLALSLDKVYSDLIRLKKPVLSFYEIKASFLGVVAFTEPNFYYLDKDFNRKEELYINSIRKQRKNPSFSHSQSLITLPDKLDGFFCIDDEEDTYHMHDAANDEMKIDLGTRSKSMVMERKHNFENEMLLTNEEKDYSEYPTDLGQKSKAKKLDSAISLASTFSSKQLNGSLISTISFSKIQDIDS